MKRLLSIFISTTIVFFACPLTSQAVDEVSINTTPNQEKDLYPLYPWITFMSEGPMNWLKESTSFEIKGRAYRVVVTTSEIYNRLLIEEITKGDEGCCVRVSSIREVDLDQFMEKCGLIGERSGFEFVRWLSPTSFEFRFHERNFQVLNVEKSHVQTT